jgi:hypothetical protein
MSLSLLHLASPSPAPFLANLLNMIDSRLSSSPTSLTHGLFLAASLCLPSLSPPLSSPSPPGFHSDLSDLCVRALLRSQPSVSAASTAAATPVTLNVNGGGCLGANNAQAGAGASKVEGQTSYVGSWLLAKEASGCLAAALSCPAGPEVSAETARMAGDTLANMLVTLKHQGAAVAVQAALLKISSFCSSKPHLRSLPPRWASDLLAAISGPDTGESTLRRSSGIAFAFQSLLRNMDPAAARSVASELISLSLPPPHLMSAHEVSSRASEASANKC